MTQRQLRRITQADFVPFDWEAVNHSHRRRLPHLCVPGGIYFVTFRLADSLPQEFSDRWYGEREAWLMAHPRPWNERLHREFHKRFTVRMERWLDAGHGACVLTREDCRNEVVQRLEFRHGTDYDLGDWVIMPNHVHCLFQTWKSGPLGELMKPIKGVSARNINQRLGLSGSLWQEESFNHVARHLDHVKRLQKYLLDNPRKAGLKPGMFSCEQRWLLED